MPGLPELRQRWRYPGQAGDDGEPGPGSIRAGRSYAHPGWRNLLFASRLPGVHVGGGPPVAEVVYGLLAVVAASVGAAVRAGRFGAGACVVRRRHRTRLAAARAEPPLRGAVSPFHGVARAAQPLLEPPRPLRGPAMVSRSPAKRPPRVHSAFCVTKLRRPLRISRHLRSEKHGPAAHQPSVRRASPPSKHRHRRSARQAGKGPAWPRQAGVESVAPLA